MHLSLLQTSHFYVGLFDACRKVNKRAQRVTNPNGQRGPVAAEGQDVFHPTSTAFEQGCEIYKISTLEQLKFRGQTIIRMIRGEHDYEEALAAESEESESHIERHLFTFNKHALFQRAREAYKRACTLSLKSGIEQKAIKTDNITDEEHALALTSPLLDVTTIRV